MMVVISMPPDVRAPHCVLYVFPAVETIVDTAVARQVDAAGVAVDVVDEAVDGTAVARRRIAATLKEVPTSKVSDEGRSA